MDNSIVLQWKQTPAFVGEYKKRSLKKANADRDYSKNLFWAMIPFAWQQVANAAWVHRKPWAPWWGPDAQPWQGLLAKYWKP